MTDIRDLEACEHRLQRAQITSDVAELDRLVHPDLQFVAPDGVTYGKADDLEYHRSGRMKVQSAEAESLETDIVDGAGVTVLVVHMRGQFNGEPFDSRIRYCRTWHQTETGWQVVRATATAIG